MRHTKNDSSHIARLLKRRLSKNAKIVEWKGNLLYLMNVYLDLICLDEYLFAGIFKIFLS